MSDDPADLKKILRSRYAMKFSPSGHAHCPFHHDTNPSFHVRKRNGRWSWRCYGCGKSGTLEDFERLAEKSGLISSERSRMKSGNIVATYDYTDKDGNLLFQCVRFRPKDFIFRRPDGRGGWTPNMGNVKRVPYRLPDVISAEQVVIVEGEKDVDNIRESLKLAATTNPMGAGKWNDIYNEYFRGKKIIIIPDNDEPGKRHAQDVANSLLGVAQEIKIVELPGLPEKGDVSDWLEKGGNLESLTQLIENTLPYVPDENEILKEEAEQPLSLSIVTLRELLAGEVQAREVLIEPVLAKGELGIVSGPAKLGKSLLCLNLVLCLASGRNWLRFRIPRPARVLLIQQEVGKAGLIERLRKMTSGTEIPNLEDVLDNIALNSTRGILLDTDAGFNAVCHSIEAHRPDILILDPLITFHTKNENSAEEMAAVFRIIHRLIDKYKIAILIIHHFGKPSQIEKEGGELHRGSSVIGSSSDSNWTFKRIPSNKYRTDRPHSEYAELSFELRNAEAPNPIILHRNSENLWYEMASLEENRRVTPEMIRDIVQQHGGDVLQDDVIKTLRPLVSDRLIKEAIYEAENRHLIDSRRIRGRGNPKKLFIRELKR